ncbi:MAG: T9SS type A sorting domain-containing protein [Armatimonadetes bacterium]|nr:T9SS type A sorting domain-containing protein [Armatimonadota bacterium]
MNLLPLLVAGLITIAAQLSAQNRYDVNMMVDSVKRETIVVVPSGTPPAGGYPVVFMFHGTSGDGEKFYNISGWKEKGEAEKFITVFPSSRAYCITEDGQQKTTTKWHCGELDEIACPGQNLKNDVTFVRAMVDSLKDRFPVNPNKFYVSGFSNGACFAFKLAVEMSDVFAAIAASGGGFNPLDSAEPKRKIPLWLTFGTNDDRWIEPFAQYGITELPYNDSSVFMFRKLIGRYTGAYGYDTTYTKDSTKTFLTYHYADPEGTTNASGFRFTLINDLYHQYPNGKNVPYAAANYYWEFFSQATGTSDVAPEITESQKLHLFPNPAHGYIVVEGSGAITLTLRNVMGEEVMRLDGFKGEHLYLPGLASGNYVAEISDQSGRYAQMIILK